MGMTKTELHELVEHLPENTLDGAAVLLRSLSSGRIDPDQAWFWTADRLSGEMEADREASTSPPLSYRRFSIIPAPHLGSAVAEVRRDIEMRAAEYPPSARR
jgi:hypothetical protein